MVYVEYNLDNDKRITFSQFERNEVETQCVYVIVYCGSCPQYILNFNTRWRQFQLCKPLECFFGMEVKAM